MQTLVALFEICFRIFGILMNTFSVLFFFLEFHKDYKFDKLERQVIRSETH